MTVKWDSDEVVITGAITVDQVDPGNPLPNRRHLMFDDGLPNMAYRILEFKIFPQNEYAVSTHTCSSYLAIHESDSLAMDLNDEHQIAWATFQGNDTLMGVLNPYTQVHGQNIIVRDLWIHLWTNSSQDRAVNYYIRFEKLNLDDNEAVIALSNEVSTMS